MESKTKINNLPSFFNYKEEGTDNGYETIQDFFLSWTLRCSANSYKEIDEKVNEYARRIVYILIYGHNDNRNFIFDKEIIDSFKVIDVKTIRQDKYIDLVAELTIEEGGNTNKYIFNIENKWYTKTSEHQLQKSREYIENKYDSKEFQIINLLIFCDDTYDKHQMELAIDNNYKCLSIDNLAGYSQIEETGNYMFDEYWFNV